MGEIIARIVADELLNAGEVDGTEASAMITTVENACLLHDVGNPPFGHLGEYAIAKLVPAAPGRCGPEME